jgi:hypothetical protein
MVFKALSRLRWFGLRWPQEVTADQVLAVLSSLNGSSTRRRAESLVLIAVGRAEGVRHLLGVPDARADGVRGQLEAIVPGLAVEPATDVRARWGVDRCWRAWLTSKDRPLQMGYPEPLARGVLTALSSVEGDETLVMRWVLGPVHRPVVVRDRPFTDPGLGLPE